MRTRTGIRRWGVAAMVAGVGLLAGETAAAQACIGYPQRSDGAVSATFSFPDEGTGYDLNGMVVSQGGGIFLQGGFGIVAPEDDDLENVKTVHGGAAFEIEALVRDASVCPLVGLSYTWVEDLNRWAIPFGVGAGMTIPLGRRGDGGFTPFVVPRFLWVRDSLDDVEDSADSEVFVGLVGGLTINVEALHVTGSVSKIFEEDDDAVFSLSVGAVWR